MKSDDFYAYLKFFNSSEIIFVNDDGIINKKSLYDKRSINLNGNDLVFSETSIIWMLYVNAYSYINEVFEGIEKLITFELAKALISMNLLAN